MNYSEALAKQKQSAIRKKKRQEKGVMLGLRRPRKKKKKVPARKRAFLRLKASCKKFVFLRNEVLSFGMCEIALSCAGENPADTWYHGWPQKGGNGLKYDVRSHFASCSACNMGEYGARYRGDKRYVNRHKELLGEELFNELESLHGRRQISQVEATEMADKIDSLIVELRNGVDKTNTNSL